MKSTILQLSMFLISISSLQAQSDTTKRMISFTANTVYFVNGLLLNTEDDDLKDLSRKWYKQCNVASPPTGNSIVTVQTDAETIFKLSAVVRQFPFRLLASQWSEISAGIDNAAVGYQPLVSRLSGLSDNDSNDRTAIRQAGKKDAQGKL